MGWLSRVTNEPGASSSRTRFDASLDLRQNVARRDGRRPLLMLKTLLADTDCVRLAKIFREVCGTPGGTPVFVSVSRCFYVEMARKQRLDLHMLTLGLAASRQQAQHSTAESSAPSRLHSDCPLVYDELNRVLGLEGLVGDFSTDAHGIVIRTVHPPRIPGGSETPPAEPSDLSDDDPCP